MSSWRCPHPNGRGRPLSLPSDSSAPATGRIRRPRSLGTLNPTGPCPRDSGQQVQSCSRRCSAPTGSRACPAPPPNHPAVVPKRSKSRCKGCATSKTRAPRSTAAHNAFRASHPCPATGNTEGECHGYVVDHVIPISRAAVVTIPATCNGRQPQMRRRRIGSSVQTAATKSARRRLFRVNADLAAFGLDA